MADAREFDLIVYGATGFTGQLVAEYLIENYSDGNLRWAMGGRSLTKLEQVRGELGAPSDIALVTADSGDPAALRDMARRARVVLTTVGPYQLYGSDLVAACAASGTHYVDLSGEPAWMRHMIDAHEATARESGACIVFSCGFDSIPFDLGVWAVERACVERFGKPAPRVKGRIKSMKGTFSGGTAASARATMAAAAKDPSILKLMIDPFALTPGFTGPDQPKGMVPHYDDAVGGWVAPFMMATINTKNVHRSNFLAGNPYGADFVYDEMMIAPGIGDMARAAAEAIAKASPIGGEGGPKPGEGPSREERETGFYECWFIAEMPDGESLKSVVKGDRDPGYGSTSKMITESALCLIQDGAAKPGIWTAGGLMPEKLAKRLEEKAGVTITIEG
tara:strand:+ start:946 stop:2121 length:1176 start_codon:yes stop_codon:yes gene_type:complete